MSKRNNLVKKFQNISHQYNLWQKGLKIVLGVSGGPDSTCMLDIFSKLAPKYNLELIIAHVNYGLRAKDSDRDEKFVREWAKKYALKIEVLRRGPTSDTLSESSRLNLNSFSTSENALREIRYKFFEKVRKENNFDLIAVAHTLDDQAETYLMRIIRGSGLAGLSAMRHKNNFIIRPLLGITKKEILKYLKKNRLSYRTDKTNKEIPYLRNKIRNRLIPFLEKDYNPKIKETLYGASLSVGEDYDFMEQISLETYKKNKKLNVKNILKLHPALRRRIILKAIEEKTGSLKDIEAANVEEVLKAVKSAKSKNQIIKFRGLKFMRKGDRIFLSLIN